MNRREPAGQRSPVLRRLCDFDQRFLLQEVELTGYNEQNLYSVMARSS